MVEQAANSDVGILDEGLAHWHALRGGKRAPDYAAFNPMAVPSLLPNAVLLGAKPDGSDYQYRVIGETVLKHMLGNYTGQWISELPHQAPPSQIHESLTEAFTSQSPVCPDAPYVGRNESLITKSDLILPFLDDNGVVSRLLVLLEFHPK